MRKKLGPRERQDHQLVQRSALALQPANALETAARQRRGGDHISLQRRLVLGRRGRLGGLQRRRLGEHAVGGEEQRRSGAATGERGRGGQRWLAASPVAQG